VEVTVCEEEPTRLIDAFGGADVAVVVDAVSTGARPGTLHRFDASDAPVPSRELRSSTHALGIGEALELARALGRLPRRTIVFGVEGSDFLARDGLTAPVAEAVGRASAAVVEEVMACTSKP
jgi:hydrogenase maturation protease